MNASPAACFGQRLQAVQAAATERDCAATWTTSSCDRANDTRTPRTIFRQSRRFIYRSPSAMKKAPSVALIHAAASLRVCATVSSCSRPLILTTQEWASKSASASAMALKYRRRALGLSVCKCARSITAVRVNSVDGAGSSPIEMGCSARLLGMAAPVVAPRRPAAMTHSHAFPRKVKSGFTVCVNPLSNRLAALVCGGAVGPAPWVPSTVSRAVPHHHGVLR